ncbi:MAG: geranylgeranyl reductase family protein [Ilumatobacteraceae bacterium]
MANHLRTDVLVVGAGPAGIAAAVTAKRQGLSVRVVDKAVFPRDKCCGDGLTTNALRRLEELGFDARAVDNCQPCRDVEIRSPKGRDVRLQLPEDGLFAAVAPRLDLDSALVAFCRDAGVEITEGAACEGVISNDTDSIITSVDSLGLVESKWVVAADGMWSPVRRSLGLSTPGYLGEWHAFRQYVSNVSGSATTTLHVWFDDDLLPGYAWSFPLPSGRANLGFCLIREDGVSVQHMNELWRGLASRPHIARALGEGATTEGRHSAWPIPARIDTAVRSAGRVLFVGDAVCATDLLTGEGIGQAVESGMAAAHAIGAGGSPGTVRARYSRELDRLFLADHRMSRAVGSALGRARIAEAALRLVDANDWTRRNFARWMFEDEMRATALTPRRWHRRFLARPGAYRDH